MSLIYRCKECKSEDIVIADFLIITKNSEEVMEGQNCFCNNCDTRTEYEIIKDK